MKKLFGFYVGVLFSLLNDSHSYLVLVVVFLPFLPLFYSYPLGHFSDIPKVHAGTFSSEKTNRFGILTTTDGMDGLYY